MKTRKPKTGRPLMGAEPRVRLAAYVAAPTHRQITGWSTEESAPSGQVIDRLVQFGLASRWSPRPAGVARLGQSEPTIHECE